MSTNINLFTGDNRKGLEKTGRVGGSNKGVNQYDLTETDIMVSKPTIRPGSLSIKLNLD